MIKEGIWRFLAWYRIKPFVRRVKYFAYLHNLAINKERSYILNVFFPSNLVLFGPFKGLKYPDFKSNGSPLLPKLIGSYEAELHEEIFHAIESGYTEIIDIGCAEGYYAIGFAIKNPKAKVYAFDIDAVAQTLCSAMATANGVDSIVEVFGECRMGNLLSLPIRERALIISDCEGHELDIFSEDIISKLRKNDFLIETHDCYDPNNSKELKARFEKTHIIKSVFSISDLEKAKKYDNHQINKIPTRYLYNLYAEERIGTTEWIICKSRENLT